MNMLNEQIGKLITLEKGLLVRMGIISLYVNVKTTFHLISDLMLFQSNNPLIQNLSKFLGG